MCAFPNLLACRLRALCVGVCVLCDWLASIDPSCCYKNWLKCARAVCFSRRQIEEDIYRYSFVLTLKKTFIATVLFLQAIAAMTTTGDSVELRLIPEYTGEGSCSIEEWLEKVQLVCDLRSVTKIETVIPLRLGGSAFAVYQQLTKSQKGDAAAIKAALIGAFGLDKFSAYEEFASRKLRPGEPVEVYLAELRKLASSFGGVTEEAMSCAFVAGLPDASKRLLRAGARIEAMSLRDIVLRARTISTEESTVCAAARNPSHGPRRAPNDQHRTPWQARPARPATGERPERRKCFRCNRIGHLIASCPENEDGEKVDAPPSSPKGQ